jgi:HK97 family phage major capsid protein
MREWLLKIIKAKEEARAALKVKGKTATTVEEVRSIGDQIDALDAELTEFRQQLDALPKVEEEIPAGGLSPEEMIARGYQRIENPLPQPQGQQRGAQGQPTPARILGTYGADNNGGNGGQGQQQRSGEPEDVYATVEYRKAFMEFAKTGKITPELRSDAMTTTSEISAVIPSTIMNEVVQNMKVYGQVFARLRKLNVKGGVTVPILSLKPAATWIGEASTSDKKKVTANTSVTFSYFGLECKVSTSLLADTVSLPGFESVITQVITEAMIKAVEIAVIAGNGSSAPLGVTIDTRVLAGQKITLSADEFGAWDAWKKKVFAKMPLAYKAGATFLMASGTFEGYIDGMVDANGQPIGRINYGITNGPQERFGGKEVILVEDDIIGNYDDAATGDVVGIYCNLSNYGFNSNMQMTMFRYFDHDTNEWIDKAILIADGRLIDPAGVIIIKKG